MTKEIDEAIEVFKEIILNPDDGSKKELTQKDYYDAFCTVHNDLILKALESYKASQCLPIEGAPKDGTEVWLTSNGVFPEVEVNSLSEKKISYYKEKHLKNGNIKQIPTEKTILVDEFGDDITWQTHYMPIPKFEEGGL